MRALKGVSLMIALLVGAAACHKNDQDTVTQEATVEQQTPQGSETTKSERAGRFHPYGDQRDHAQDAGRDREDEDRHGHRHGHQL